MATINLSKKNYKSNNDNGKRALRSKYYNSKDWKLLRLSKLLENPLCFYCEQKGIVTPATEVHHEISPFNNIDRIHELFYDYENLTSICATCHREQHNNMSHLKNT